MLYVFNNNPLATLPDQERVRRGLLREDLFTLVHDQVMTDTAALADLVLPSTHFLEHGELTHGYGALVVTRWSAVAPPPGEARSNVAVFEALLDRLGLSEPGDPRGEEALTAALLQGAPPDLRAALDAQGAAAPPCGPSPVAFVDVFPATPDQRIDLLPAALDAAAPGGLYHFQPDPAQGEARFALISPAVPELISSTFGHLDPTPASAVIHPDDAHACGVLDGALVRLHNTLGEVVVRARLSDRVRPGVISLPKGLWAHHTANGATANALIPDTLSDVGGGACYNDARVALSPA